MENDVKLIIEYWKNYETKNKKLIRQETNTNAKDIIQQLAIILMEHHEYSIVYNTNGLKDVRAYNKIKDKNGDTITIVRIFNLDLF